MELVSIIEKIPKGFRGEIAAVGGAPVKALETIIGVSGESLMRVADSIIVGITKGIPRMFVDFFTRIQENNSRICLEKFLKEPLKNRLKECSQNSVGILRKILE